MLATFGANESLTIVLAGAATTQPTYSAQWREEDSLAVNNPVGTMNSTTAVTVVSAPGTGRRILESLTVYNRDAASQTVTVAKVVSGTSYTLSKIALASGSQLIWDKDGITVLDSSGQMQTSSGATSSGAVGAAAGTGVVATESSLGGHLKKTVLTLTDVTVALVDEAGVVGYLGQKIYDFPAGLQLLLGITASLAVTKSSAGINDDWDGDFAVGTVTASNNGTLTSTEANMIASTATPQAVAGATTAIGANAPCLSLDGTATAKDMFLNLLVDDADQDVTGTPCNVIFNGTITFFWLSADDV